MHSQQPQDWTLAVACPLGVRDLQVNQDWLAWRQGGKDGLRLMALNIANGQLLEGPSSDEYTGAWLGANEVVFSPMKGRAGSWNLVTQRIDSLSLRLPPGWSADAKLIAYDGLRVAFDHSKLGFTTMFLDVQSGTTVTSEALNRSRLPEPVSCGLSRDASFSAGRLVRLGNCNPGEPSFVAATDPLTGNTTVVWQGEGPLRHSLVWERGVLLVQIDELHYFRDGSAKAIATDDRGHDGFIPAGSGVLYAAAVARHSSHIQARIGPPAADSLFFLASPASRPQQILFQDGTDLLQGGDMAGRLLFSPATPDVENVYAGGAGIAAVALVAGEPGSTDFFDSAFVDGYYQEIYTRTLT
jgi:hypothetical protein